MHAVDAVDAVDALKSAFESIGEAAIAADNQGLVVFINRRALEVTGFTAADAVGQPLASVFSVSPAFEIASDVRVSLVRRSGELTVVEHTIAPILDERGHERGTVVTFRDVTERLQIDESRALTERLSSVATIAAGVSHELNNPVASIESNLVFALREITELRKKSPRLDCVIGDAGDALEDCMLGVERVKEIIRQLKVFLFAAAGPARVDVNHAMRMAARLCSTAIDSAAELEEELDEVPDVLVDEGQLVQCFMNIFKNATQAFADRRRGRITMRSFHEPPYAIVEISDDGDGIEAKDIGRVFEPFFTTRDPGKGVGLGLSIARAVVLRCGGTIAATSTVGAGATFRIQLPLAAYVEDGASDREQHATSLADLFVQSRPTPCR